MKTITKKALMAKLGNFVSVENTESRNGYGQAPNQFEIRFENGRVFQSYQSLVAANIHGQLYFSGYHDYSNTTSRHCGQWCGYSTKERRDGLEKERFILIIDE